MSQPQKCTFLEEVPKNLKTYFSPYDYLLSLCFYNFTLKGHLRYKTITSQNVPSEAKIKNFFYFIEKLFCCQDIQVFVFLTITSFTKSVTWCILVHETRTIFGYEPINHNSLSNQPCQLIDLSNNFQESFEQFGGLGLGSRSFLI